MHRIKLSRCLWHSLGPGQPLGRSLSSTRMTAPDKINCDKQSPQPFSRSPFSCSIPRPSAIISQGLRVGAWRSLVAHYNGVVGVEGSNPFAPTNRHRTCREICRSFFYSEALKDRSLLTALRYLLISILCSHRVNQVIKL